jgi:hypothetical protein
MNVESKNIQERAYHIWENEGRPHGRDFEHWLKAEQELASPQNRRKPRASRAKASGEAVKKRAATTRTRAPKAPE